MNEFDDASMEFSETETIEVPETSDWVDFDSAETNDIGIDTAENVDVEDIPDLPLEAAFDDSDIQSEAKKAADYARSYGFDKAADYIEGFCQYHLTHFIRTIIMQRERYDHSRAFFGLPEEARRWRCRFFC